MASFTVGSLSKDTYLEWIDMIEGHATDSGIWLYIDPMSSIAHNQPKKPEPSDYNPSVTSLSDLNEDEKLMYREDDVLYRVDIQSYRQEKKLIGELRSKIVESLHQNHRKLIFGCMSCSEVLLQIKIDLSQQKIFKL